MLAKRCVAEFLDKETNLTTTFDSFSAAATALDIRQEAIKNYLARNQQKPYKGRYIFTQQGLTSLPLFRLRCLLF
jgi:hypothetical protein